MNTYMIYLAYTIEWEILVVKILWVAPPSKIKCMKFFTTIYVHIYVMFFHVHILYQLPLDPRYLLLDLCCSIIYSSLSELDNAYHANETVVYHEASQLLSI